MNVLWDEWQDIRDNISFNLLDMTKIKYKNFSKTTVDKEFYDFYFRIFLGLVKSCQLRVSLDFKMYITKLMNY